MRTKNVGATEVAVDGYKLISIERTRAPDDSAGDDWHVYRIEQGTNAITGYRRGTAVAVAAAVREIIDALNQRRMVRPQAEAPAPRPAPAVKVAPVPVPVPVPAPEKDLV